MNKIISKCIILVIILGVSWIASLSHISGPMKEMNDYAGTSEEKTAIPQNYLTSVSNSSPDDCILINAIDNANLPSRRFTPNEYIHLNLSPADLAAVFVPNIPGLLQHAATTEFLTSHPGAELHCRDGLNSEEPPQV